MGLIRILRKLATGVVNKGTNMELEFREMKRREIRQAAAQLNPPSYRKPSDLRYVLHGYWEDYVREHGGKQLVFFTNSRKNLDFYLKRGDEVFDEREIPEKDVINGLLAVRDQSFRRSVNHPLKINPESLPMACRDKADGFV